MKSMRQLLRQPVRMFAGVILVALAVAILCVCFGQGMVADQFLATLPEHYTSIAVPGFLYHMDGERYASANYPEEVAAVIRQIIAENPEVVKGQSTLGLATAYIPGLEMEYNHNYTTVYYDNAAFYYFPFCGWEYSPKCVMLEITVTDIEKYSIKTSSGEDSYMCGVYAVVESVPGLAAGYADLPGTEVLVYWETDIEESGIADADEIQMEIGQRYLVYGMDFMPQAIFADYFFPGGPEPGEEWLPSQFSLIKYENIPKYQNIENIEAYAVPLYAKLEGTVEEFLASDEAAPWRETLERLEVNNHAFSVLGVENLDMIPDFNYNSVTVIEGREFTEEELASGARVCLISQRVAEQNGLTVGDKLTLQFFEHDDNSIYQDNLSEGMGVINPLPEFYTAMTPFANDGEEYTIVGLYHQKYHWNPLSDNLYAFTPNTVFVPSAAVPVEMQYSDQGMFGVLELYDGTIEEFYSIIDKAGYTYLYECYDQGYTVIEESIVTFQMLSQKVALIGLAVYGVILLLYLVIFPAQQGNSLRLMNVMGATPKEKALHILTTGVGILLPGTALGMLAAVFLWDETIQILTKAVAVNLELQLDMGVLLGIGAAQLLLALVLTVLLSIPLLLTNPMKRK